MLPVCCFLSSTALSFPIRNLSGHLESAHRTSGGSSFLSPQERDNDPEPSIWAFPVATTLCTVSSPVLELFIFFFFPFLKYFFSVYNFYNLRRDQFESLISRSKSLTIPQTCWILVWIISSVLHLNCCTSGLGNGCFTAAKVQTKLSFISIPSAWAADPESAWQGGILFLFHAPPSGAPWEIAKFQQRFPQNQAGPKLSLAPF